METNGCSHQVYKWNCNTVVTSRIILHNKIHAVIYIFMWYSRYENNVLFWLFRAKLQFYLSVCPFRARTGETLHSNSKDIWTIFPFWCIVDCLVCITIINTILYFFLQPKSINFFSYSLFIAIYPYPLFNFTQWML